MLLGLAAVAICILFILLYAMLLGLAAVAICILYYIAICNAVRACCCCYMHIILYCCMHAALRIPPSAAMCGGLVGDAIGSSHIVSILIYSLKKP
jgi:hypothetical protein